MITKIKPGLVIGITLGAIAGGITALLTTPVTGSQARVWLQENASQVFGSKISKEAVELEEEISTPILETSSEGLNSSISLH